jgi:hypothetical protein
MALATIWRDPKQVTDKQAVMLRDVLQFAIQTTLGVELDHVEVRVKEIGPLDINYKAIGIEIDTGTGKRRCRVRKKKEIVLEIADRVARSGVLKAEWVGPDKSYAWIRICESAFVPIGYPDQAR